MAQQVDKSHYDVPADALCSIGTQDSCDMTQRLHRARIIVQSESPRSAAAANIIGIQVVLAG